MTVAYPQVLKIDYSGEGSLLHDFSELFHVDMAGQ